MSDYVIVGGGSAGCVLANRLSADPHVKVTLLEAGPDDNHFFYRMPAGYFQLMKTGRGNWRYETVPQPGLNGRTMYVPRGKLLGGSSMINGLVWIRGNAGDFDHWAALGNAGWSYADCLPYFRRIETYAGGANEYRGGNGPIHVTTGPDRSTMSPVPKAWIEAAVSCGHPYNPDLNGASQEGFGPASGTFADGVRQSAAARYLEPVRHRPNLTVLPDSLATRVLSEGRRAVGVEYVRKGRTERLHADREVILAGGAINSPQLLQLSGIGDPVLLRTHGITVKHELPGVGQNLQDHLSVSVKQEITRQYSALQYVQPRKALVSLLQYLLFKSGPTLTNGLEAMAFVKSQADMAYPDVQYHLPLLMYEDHGRVVHQKEGFTAHTTACQPKSRGSVKIRSADPTEPPAIDPRYLDDPGDLHALRASIRIAREVIAQAPFEAWRGAEFAPGPAVQTNEELDAYIRATAVSVYHHVGTCRMGHDALAVVDDKLRVLGMERLRVIDASVMPRIITGNTYAATLMIAEKGAELVSGTQVFA